MKAFKLNDPVYGSDVRLVVNYSNEEFKKWCNKHFNLSPTMSPTSSGSYYALVHDEGKVIHVICIRNVDDEHMLGTLAHEVSHFVFDLLQLRGMIYSDDSDEAYAYMIGYIYNQCIGKLRRMI